MTKSNQNAQWPTSESFLTSLTEIALDVLQESLDELIDDAFSFQVPAEYAKTWIEALKQRDDREQLQSMIDNLQWFVDQPSKSGGSPFTK